MALDNVYGKIGSYGRETHPEDILLWFLNPSISSFPMKHSLGHAFVRYHRGLGRMPVRWKPWLLSLLLANMIVPLFYLTRLEAQVVLGVALLGGATFVVLTAFTGFSRLLGLAHLWWIPLILFLLNRLAPYPVTTAYGFWLRAVIVLDAGSLILDAANVVRYLRGDRQEMVAGLSEREQRDAS
jgi:hypothetical protein